ncbi:copper resistance protein CopC [Krasilnikovia sp. MM14-A1004]|uniref:copper resistance CopC/CopD family protein n=1 Tax=Krasilnikovia sp. MM14-A1004 TaxID=3373541 RepID=UPI00399CC9EA
MTGADAAGGPPTTRASRARVLPAWIVAVLAGAAALLLPTTPAYAHAAMVAAAPAAGSVVGASPTEVTVVFSEPVTPVAGRVQVLAPDGTRISGAASAEGTVLRIPVRRADRPLGTYLVSYRVISADSHPVGGALTFSVGAPSARPAEPQAVGVHPSVAVAVPAARFLGYAGLTLAVGPALLLALLWPRRLPRRGPIRLVRTGLGLLAVSTLAGLWVQAPNSSGDPLWQTSPGELGDVLASPYGLALVARLALLAIVAVLLPPVLHGTAGRGRALTVTGLTLAALVTWPLTGHAVAAPLSGVVAAADVVHLAAMAVWLGGLVTLAVFLLRRAHPRVLAVLLPSWSRWAALAVVWLVGGGVVQAVVQVGSVPAMWRTDHGRLLLAKVAVLTLTLGAAAYARRLVRRDPAAGLSRLRRTVAVEAAATCVVLGLSAVLVQATPGRSVAAERAATSNSGVSQTLSCPLFTLQFNVYPVEVGENNTVHAFVYTPAGAPLPAEEWTITTRLTGTDIEPVRTAMLPLVPRHHAVGALTFPLAGTYEVKFTVRVSDIDQGTVTTTITVPGAAPPA